MTEVSILMAVLFLFLTGISGFEMDMIKVWTS